MSQKILQKSDRLEHFLVFVLDLLAFQRGQPPELHIEDGLGLEIAEFEAAHQPFLGLIGVLGFADGLDHRVEIGSARSAVPRGCGRGLWPAPVRISNAG